jgi:hypothetical protein
MKRPSAVDALITTAEVLAVMGVFKVLAIRFHQHGLAQAYLTLY